MRYSGFLVALEEPVSSGGEGEAVLSAIRQLRGVMSVEPVPCDELHEAIVAERVRREVRERLLAALRAPGDVGRRVRW